MLIRYGRIPGEECETYGDNQITNIKLGQALKATGMVESGVEAKEVIQEGLVMVNGETETRRGRKLYGGDVVLFDGEEIRIEG